jgi:hypothetical protein
MLKLLDEMLKNVLIMIEKKFFGKYSNLARKSYLTILD